MLYVYIVQMQHKNVGVSQILTIDPKNYIAFEVQ